MTFAVVSGVFVASLAGSLHCLAMCGPLVGLHGGARTMRLAFTHALGRLTTYVLFGAVAGAVGSAVDLAGRVGNVQRAATLLAAALIIGLGVAQLVQAYRKYLQSSCISSDPVGEDKAQLDRSARVPAGTTGCLRRGATAPRSKFLSALVRIRRRAAARGATAPRSTFASALVRIRPRTAARRSYWIGMLTGLLPCGWLWAFVMAAAGTASPLGGALVMLAFWLGTVPAMVGLLRVTGPLLANVRARMPAVIAVALIAIGVGTLALRWRDAGVTQVDRPHCHCHEANA